MNHFTFHNFIKASSQKGGALIYILIAIALLAALTTTFIQPGGQSSRTQNAFKTATVINSQGRLVRSAIQDCILRFPQGDNAITEVGYINPYPLNPDTNEAQYAAYKVANKQISEIRCPGANYTQIFSGGGEFSSYLPSPPDLMEQWTYFNGDITAAAGAPGYNEAFDGVFYQIQSDKSDPFIGEAMTKIDGLSSACEVDHQIGTGTNGCEDEQQCLRFWIIRRGGGPTGVANADNGSNPCP